MTEWTYSKAGVDIEKEATAIRSIADFCKATFQNRPGEVLGDIGNFANLISINDEQALVLCTDGVGTKVLVAEALKKYDTIGIDMVAMNVNDAICVGAEPIALVDYLAVQKPTPELLSEIGKGVRAGADEAGIAVIGGETATLPELIKGDGNGFDLAGTCLGVVDKDNLITGEKIKVDDVLIGLPSSGLHSNGYTLARKVLDMEDKEVLEEMLIPTKIYVKPILKLLKHVPVHGLCHMTGGGLLNLLRLNKFMGFDIKNWPNHNWIFKQIRELGNVSEEEMFKTFNMGVGFCVAVSPEHADQAMDALRGENPTILGKAIRGNKIVKNGLTFGGIE